MKKKVMIGMSGGVDSSVAAALLQDQGYDVTGVMLKLWDEQGPGTTEVSRSCCSIEDVSDARGIAFKLSIPFYVLNMKDLFQEKVVDYFIDAYLKGQTPNPCIACNEHLKFQAMLEKAYDLDMDYIATGHYARRILDQKSGLFQLAKAADVKKDQSYVLYMLSQDQLKHTLFPLGELDKPAIRRIAADKELKVHSKPDSQDICFVSSEGYGDFISTHAPGQVHPGNFMDANGKILGTHKGLVYYTVGQRKGLGIAAAAPLYVIRKNPVDNTIVLGSRSETLCKTFSITHMNYIDSNTPTEKFKAMAKVRYTAKEAEVTVTPTGKDTAIIEFDTSQPFVAPGQSAVLYSGNIVLGGGIIQNIDTKKRL